MMIVGCPQGLKFYESYRNCDHLALENGDVPFLGYEDLIINKILAGRLKDQADVEELQKIHRKKQACALD